MTSALWLSGHDAFLGSPPTRNGSHTSLYSFHHLFVSIMFRSDQPTVFVTFSLPLNDVTHEVAKELQPSAELLIRPSYQSIESTQSTKISNKGRKC
jgi:hypothetical protein